MAEFRLMRKLYPALEMEIALVENRMEKAALGEAVPPPSRVWEGIQQRLNWKSTQQQEEEDERRKHYTFINMQPKEGTYISVHRSWRPIVIAIVVLCKICLVAAVYYYFKTQVLQDKLEDMRQQQNVTVPR
ncbi:hypothetical protein [Chitinophaga costaii]|uniref:hypothetical protein n=1 Tax=Chitinophaga costaii TaxID=1335309 RepID=UPI000F504094|nr:hypothetical protein [Chitinophaga costaii]